MRDDLLVTAAVQDGVGIATLRRPAAKNALSVKLVAALTCVLETFESDREVRAILLAGEGGCFAAGADIKEMLPLTVQDVIAGDFAGCCTRLAAVKKPVVAAVDGFALGGGCELVEACDIVIASVDAVFAHPEVRLGTMPGAGGTQRLPRSVGKHLAMDMLLTGRQLTADEALRFGLVSRVVPAGELRATALRVAADVASLSGPVTQMIKQAVCHGLNEHDGPGYALERKLFHLGFALEDRREGMQAFLEKRPPSFRHR
ncbi:MAG TPA: enoyl-CoA hydratase-related protein [Noviherbaspirillum sp.]|jgi:enoyl-CoA hydratase/carnithine racemase|uniref:enoyl-CoA hydratase-related protein n=1 Tax=Noviherbaspirillum sp. TaxID=1926288 RepID=UPI002F95C97E